MVRESGGVCGGVADFGGGKDLYRLVLPGVLNAPVDFPLFFGVYCDQK
jgi:hypothetical protein